MVAWKRHPEQTMALQVVQKSTLKIENKKTLNDVNTSFPTNPAGVAEWIACSLVEQAAQDP